jgi:glycosyltransferase involved in cell wall biosynthesis
MTEITADPKGKTVISVITVCLNCVDSLPATVDSLHRQTWPWREWVVMDGGSKDGTQNLVSTGPERPTQFRSEPDKGIYDAMNKALALATGDVVYFLNADDALYDEHVLADVAREFDADPELDFLFGSIVIRKPDKRIHKRYGYINRWTLPFEDLCHQAIFVRRSLFQRVGTFDLNWRTSADYDWFLRVFAFGGKVKYIDRRVAYFAAGGFHAQQPGALADERRSLRLRYVSPRQLMVGSLMSRAAHKISRLLRGGRRVGESFDP